MLWKVSGQDLEPVSGSTFADLKLKEQSLEDWIERKPEVLGEPLLIIGRQVQATGVENRIDLLALDREGKIVIIEVKRDTVDAPVEFQALRYASALAHWSYESIKNQAESYYRDKDPNSEPRFQELVSNFLEEEVDLNEDQRIIIVGRNVHERLITVASWLLNHNVNVKIVEVSLFLDGKTVLLSPDILLPQESLQVTGVPDGQTNKPWEDGKKWHLQERCSAKTAPLMQTLADKVPAIVAVEGVSWNQKYYVALRLHGRNWLTVETRPNQLLVAVHVTPGYFKVDEVANLLGIVVFDHSKTLADKLDTPSSADIEHREGQDVVLIRVKPGFDFESEGFAEFIRQAYKAALR
ncbi:MAG: DUF91 domain-containing protein [Anaerolineae bacterium]|nr:DUF91 domain-containing protein [Anaerolineae bacterium]